MVGYDENMYELEMWIIQLKRCLFNCKYANRPYLQRKILKLQNIEKNMMDRKREWVNESRLSDILGRIG